MSMGLSALREEYQKAIQYQHSKKRDKDAQAQGKQTDRTQVQSSIALEL